LRVKWQNIKAVFSNGRMRHLFKLSTHKSYVKSKHKILFGLFSGFVELEC